MESNQPTGAEDVRWNLSALYQGPNDPSIDRDMADWAMRATAFESRYRGKLAESLGAALRDFADLQMSLNAPTEFLSLLCALNTGDAAAKAKQAELDMTVSRVSADHLEFFTHELATLAEADIQRQAAEDDCVRKHLPFIRNKQAEAPYHLSEDVETALTKREPFGFESWTEFYSEAIADLRFPWAGEQRTLVQMLHMMGEERTPSLRAAALKAINDGLGGGFAKYCAQTLYMVAGAAEVERRERNYPHPMVLRNLDNRLSDSTVEALHAAVTAKAAPLAQRFYRLKAKLLGVPLLAWSDRNAKLPFTSERQVPWSEAMRIAMESYGGFSPTLADAIEQTASNGWIDAAPSTTKRGGAFNDSFSVRGNRPMAFTFMNYQGSERDVMTLVHELGHGGHAMLAGEAQGELMQHPPMALAETASVFGETTAFNHMLGDAQQPPETWHEAQRRLALVISKLDDMMNVCVRQICFSNFERRLHGWDPVAKTWGPVRKHSAEELNAIWMEVTRELYGEPGDVFTYENTEHLWTYVHHFHSPFYVYCYAVGELFTQSLYAAQPRLGDRFEPLFLDLLRAGGSTDAVTLMAPFGLNPEDPAFWENGIAVGMGRMVEQAEALYEETRRLSWIESAYNQDQSA